MHTLPNTVYGNPPPNLNKFYVDEIENNLHLPTPKNPDSFNLNNIPITQNHIQIAPPKNYIDLSQAPLVYPMPDPISSSNTDSN